MIWERPPFSVPAWPCTCTQSKLVLDGMIGWVYTCPALSQPAIHRLIEYSVKTRISLSGGSVCEGQGWFKITKTLARGWSTILMVANRFPCSNFSTGSVRYGFKRGLPKCFCKKLQSRTESNYSLIMEPNNIIHIVSGSILFYFEQPFDEIKN